MCQTRKLPHDFKIISGGVSSQAHAKMLNKVKGTNEINDMNEIKETDGTNDMNEIKGTDGIKNTNETNGISESENVASAEKRKPVANIVLVEPEIPPNTGNISRTCAITGAKLHLVKPLGFKIDDKSVKRAGLDYWDHLNLEIHESLEAFLEKYGHNKLYLATTHGGVCYSDLEYEEGCFILFGKETAGLPKDLIAAHPDTAIRIPMGNHPDLRSLNLSNSAAIILYEVLRQTGFPGLV